MDKEVIDGHVKALMGSLDTGKCKQLVMENDEEKCDWMFGQDYFDGYRVRISNPDNYSHIAKRFMSKEGVK